MAQISQISSITPEHGKIVRAVEFAIGFDDSFAITRTGARASRIDTRVGTRIGTITPKTIIKR